jgi:hypothetical protein
MKQLIRIFLIAQLMLLSLFAAKMDNNKTEAAKTTKYIEGYVIGGEAMNLEKDSKVRTIYSADIHKSQQQLDKAFAPIAVMDKILDPRSFLSIANLYRAHFYSYESFSGVSKPESGILQKIAVVDDKDEEVEIWDQNYPDCIERKYMLVKKGSRIYLLTARRALGFGVAPVNDPSEQWITIYVLSANEAVIPFFKQKSRFKSKKAICDDTEAKKLLEEIVLNKL